MNIVSKFTVGSEDGIGQLFFLREAQIREMYANVTPPSGLLIYIKAELNYESAINELNDLSTQMIIVSVDNEPVGFAIFKHSPNFPDILLGKKALHYSSFFILPEHDLPEVCSSLWQKCLSVTKSYDAHWIEVLENDPLIPFLESCGFIKHTQSLMPPFDQRSFIMIWSKNK